jgi:hypothetical protein
MIERNLMAIGFQPHGDGTLHSPGRVTLTPSGGFYRVSIELPGGEILSCHIAKVALKISKGEKT